MRLLLVPIAAAALVLAGCSQETAGDATPGNDGGSTDRPILPGEPAPTSEPSEPSGDPGDSGTTNLQPCELLSGDDQTQLQVEGGTEVEGSDPSCEWKKSGSYTVAVDLVNELGLDDVQSSSPTKSMTIGSHDAVQFTGAATGCGVALGVTETSRVDVLSAASSDQAKACDIAKQAAELVEPKLP